MTKKKKNKIIKRRIIKMINKIKIKISQTKIGVKQLISRNI